MNSLGQLLDCISWIYTPGNRPERFVSNKIPTSTGRILDLEDAIIPDEKTSARENIVAFLSHTSSLGSWFAVRINHDNTGAFRQDLEALAPFAQHITIVFPKTEEVADLDQIGAVIAQARVIIMIESALGIVNVEKLVSHPLVVGVMLGGADLASDLNVSGSWASLLYARQSLIVQAKARKLPIWDSPYFDLGNQEGLAQETQLVRELGFTGKVALHPDQIKVIESIFFPTDEEISWAKTVVDTLDGGVASAAPQGKFIDKAMLIKAQHILSTVEKR